MSSHYTDLITRLVNKASKLGAQGCEVIGWLPPMSGSDDPDGQLLFIQQPPQTGSDTPWHQK